jgi:type VI secretion system protein
MSLVIVAGCSTTTKVRSMFGGLLPVQVRIDPHANDDSAMAVDFVTVYDNKLLDELLTLPASKWFDQKTQLMADHRNELAVESREWVPGQHVAPLKLKYRPGARQVVVFVDYASAGIHRAAVAPQQPFRLVLGEHELSVEIAR